MNFENIICISISKQDILGGVSQKPRSELEICLQEVY